MAKEEAVYGRYLKIKDRPREKLLEKGRQALSKSELLGWIIGSGFQDMNAVDLARQMLKACQHNLAAMAKLSVKELTQFKGIGPEWRCCINT